MRFAVGVMLFVWAGCGSNHSQQPKSAAGTKAPDQAKIIVGDKLGCNAMTKYVRPIYPRQARKDRLQGIVHFRALITKTGEVTQLEVLSGDPALVAAATDAVKQWRYTPCLFDGDPVEIKSTIDVPFTLNQ